MVLDKIIYHENADQIGIYQYHQNGLIKRYEYHFDNILLYYTDYTYSGDKLSAKKIYEKTIAGDYKLLQQDIYNYEFGRLKSVYMSDSQENIFSFTWDGEKITRVDYSYSWNRTLQKAFYEIEYDNKGNISKATNYYLNANQPYLMHIVEYEYDDKVNPLFDLTEPIDFELRSPNNVVKKTQRSNLNSPPHTITEIEYSYNEFDLPQEKTEVINSYGVITTINHKFFYKKI